MITHFGRSAVTAVNAVNEWSEGMTVVAQCHRQPEATRPYEGAASWRYAVKVTQIEQIFLDEICLIVWQRAAMAKIDVRSMLGQPRRTMRVLHSRDLSSRAVSDALNIGLVCGLAADISVLCELFHTITDATEMGVRLECTDRQTCPKFHTDRVTLRLMTTYHGPATEWLDQGRVHQAVAGDVLLSKGESWAATGGACVHRSPAIRSGEWRMLVTLDAMG